ncbi:helix-turn-helix domain-containing protein [Paractinoplanes brasiliensis]|uniref:Helix-turn-helix protein n=1 Tax=Paractinoplanes brasiliensis TaxID=52695 RepID=A0A4R6J8M5_9ACTN|nr:helix-turn-helix transcriptional regulator [Actinoplanes brasiliensis]TDO31241.1 helix-turn-helix protein [Actinoplanes brasiliensis]GID28440.1 transcriptional regulator [Actinoplanes brasiliensis]
MGEPEPNSTVPRRQLGRFLRQQREKAGVTVKAASDHLECSTQKLWRIEKGAVPVRGADVRTLCLFYQTPNEITEALIGLAKETRAKGWWAAHGDAVPDWFDLYIGLESAASHIRKYEPTIIPGLLQAHAYMEAVLRADGPDLTDTELESRIKIRQERQGLLSRHFPAPPRLEVVVAESALHARIDIPGAMQQQLFHLLKANEQPHISVRVLPTSAGPHRASVSGAFSILEFPSMNGEVGEPPTVYSESLTGALYLDRPRELAVYEQAWNALVALALPEGDSDDMIKKIMTTGEMSSRE